MPEKTKLREFNIIKAESKSSEIFTRCIARDFTAIQAASPSHYVKNCWFKYVSDVSAEDRNNALKEALINYKMSIGEEIFSVGALKSAGNTLCIAEHFQHSHGEN